MSSSQFSQHHSLEGNNSLRSADYTSTTGNFNQGIIDGRPEGRQPEPSAVTVDEYVDKDASATNSSPDHPPVPTASSTLTGATSADVNQGYGHPGQGMSSKEMRHDGQPGRKRHGQGVEQFGEGMAGEQGRGSGAVRIDGASERRFVAGRNELDEEQ
ncbi:hypothetical protein SERLA73DRAFT_74369 [Serpula lacrymans var. lacrymans S7.3]|uniref:Uncharacterized protein n=2 Tax=Serpula lacrymans var. lacrymans TaxID=341189 RepID=F8Q1F7_SERL3|nr:uncharacterized protein SERLADRAFT_416087 [Serpula lacrymans var. lacrymans S7.9]EGN98135.1 hypothetical protein SERLA73DRAFT_74369 [Serpula lacrymans var. lacrymans S7.3]EGO23715.1 hypothetical protein SERLADRAFT_416087 [Serpula lacrymans var. lacrymans S7.9]